MRKVITKKIVDGLQLFNKQTTGGQVKVTSFNVSKKLAEIGFKSETKKCWCTHNGIKPWCAVVDFDADDKVNEQILAYDLETLLEALPKQYEDKFGYTQSLFLDMADKLSIYYDGEFGNIPRKNEVVREENESLADTAARLILKLHEKNLIKFDHD